MSRFALSLVFPAVLLLAACAGTPQRAGGDAAAVAAARQDYAEALKAWRDGELTRAHQAVQRALQRDPNNVRALELKALIEQKLGRDQLARETFQRALALAPEDPALITNWANFLCSHGQRAEAERNFLFAAQLSANPHPDIALTNAGQCALRGGDLARAERLLAQALQNNPGQAVALYRMAEIRLRRGDAQGAYRWLQQYLAHAPHTPQTLLLGARIEQALGNAAGVAQYVARLESAWPDAPETRAARRLAASAPAASSPPAAGQTHDAAWIRSRPPGHYTLQLLSTDRADTLRQVIRHAQRHLPGVPLASWVTEEGGKRRYHLVAGDYADYAAANDALGKLPEAVLALRPWVRDFASIQARLASP